jgi:formate dehydrogenase major subunit
VLQGKDHIDLSQQFEQYHRSWSRGDEHFNTGEMSRRTTKLSKLKPSAYLDMNPEDAEEAGLEEGDTVRMTSPHGTVTLPLKLAASM